MTQTNPDIKSSSNDEVGSASPNPTPPHKQFSRRKVLALAGSGTLVLVAGGVVWRAADRGVFSTGQGPPTSRGMIGVRRLKGRLISCVQPSWRPIRITANPGSSMSLRRRSTCLPTADAILGRLILSCARCISGWAAPWKTCCWPQQPMDISPRSPYCRIR